MVKERRSEKELRQMMLAAARTHEECSELEDLFIFGLGRRHGLAPIGALGSQARRTRSLWPATRASTRSPVTFRKNMSCIRSGLPGATSKLGFGPWSMTNQRSRPGSHVPAAPTTSPRSRNWKVILHRVYSNVSEHRILALAAGMAYYSLLAIFPALAALVAV